MDEKYLLKIENLSISFEEVILQKCQFCANKGELVLIKRRKWIWKDIFVV